MKSIGADTLCLSALILLTALSNNINGEDGNQTTTAHSTSSDVSNTTVIVPITVQSNITTKAENISAPTRPPALSTTRPSDLTDNKTKAGTEETKVSNTTDQYHPANASSTVLTNDNLSPLNSTNATSNYNETQPTVYFTDGKIEVNTTAGQNNVLKSPEVLSDKIPTEHEGTKEIDGKDQKGEVKSTPKSRKGIFIGVGCVLAAVVFVVLIFLYKMCHKKSPAAENSEIKVSAQTKESVKLLSVKTATPHSDSKRMSSNQMESIEC